MGAVTYAVTLNDAGAIAAIVAGSVATILFIFGIGTWLRNRIKATSIVYGLTVGPAAQVTTVVDTRKMMVPAGVSLTSNKDIPLYYEVQKCHVTVDNRTTELGTPHTGELPPRQHEGFSLPPIEVDGIRPVAGVIAYRVAYRELRGKRCRRYVEGAFGFPIVPPTAGGEPLAEGSQVKREVVFEKPQGSGIDKPLSRRQAKTFREEAYGPDASNLSRLRGVAKRLKK